MRPSYVRIAVGQAIVEDQSTTPHARVQGTVTADDRPSQSLTRSRAVRSSRRRQRVRPSSFARMAHAPLEAHGSRPATFRAGRRPDIRAPWRARRISLHARHPADDVPRPPLDDAAVRRVRHGRGVERALSVSARAGRQRPERRVRSADADGLRLRPSARRAAKSAASASRSTRSRTWRRCSTASRSIACRRR